jgi:hypothetical protein
MILNLAYDCFYNISEQWDANRKFFLDKLPYYREFDRLYNQFLENNELFFKFLYRPKDEKPDENYKQTELTYTYHEYLVIFLAYYILRINGIAIYTMPKLRRIDELVNFVTPWLFEKDRKQLVLPENIALLLRSVIEPEKNIFFANKDTFIFLFFLVKVFSAISNDKTEIDDLYKRVDADTQYQIKRITYRKKHDLFNADEFLQASLPFNLWKCFGDVEKNIPDNTLFKNLLVCISKIERNPKLLMEVSRQLARMSIEQSFLSRVANSEDNDLKQMQRNVLMDLYDRAVREDMPAIFEFYIFLNFCFILKNAETEFFHDPVFLKEITAKSTRFLNFLKTIHTLNLTADAEMFYYDCANNVAWFLKLHYDHWKGVKLLLNVLRASKKTWVKPNLSYAQKFGYENLAFLITKYFLSKNDDELERLRQEMANGLADLLKPILEKKRDPERIKNYPEYEKSLDGFDITLFEPNPLFRYAYVRAIGDLGVDPDGTGRYIHTILDKTAENDPAREVRQAAVSVSGELQNLNDGWKKGNSTRFLNEAYWWIRRAHFLMFDKEKYDEKAANEFRIWENRRYK